MIGLDKYKAIFLIFISCILYLYICYFLERTDFNTLLFVWISLFSCFCFLIKSKQLTFKYLAAISILFRLILLFQIPNLSQDFYRFIWDGRMLLEGLNPYLSLPETFINQHSFPVNQAIDLYAGMGELNGSHYTNYPPINQFCFLIAAIFANKSIIGSVVVMRLIIIFADVGILYFGKKILAHLKIPVHTIFWYILNPFIIIEMTVSWSFCFWIIWAGCWIVTDPIPGATVFGSCLLLNARIIKWQHNLSLHFVGLSNETPNETLVYGHFTRLQGI